MFFLLHEQPVSVRTDTIAEAISMTRPGGKAVLVDYHAPHRLNRLRDVMRPVLSTLEPSALDSWQPSLKTMLPPDIRAHRLDQRYYGGGLYQKMVIELSE